MLSLTYMSRRSPIALSLLTAVVLSGCGAPAVSEAGPAVGGFPVTLRTGMGEVVIPAPPERVVAIGVAERDVTVALGVRPVAVGGYGELDSWFTAEYPAGDVPENLEINTGIPIEQVAALGPDLVVTGWGEDDEYRRLSAVAPTLSTAAETFSTDWRDQTRTIATALGRSERAEELIADRESRIAAVRTEQPELAGLSVTFSAYDPGSLSLVDLPTAPVIRLLEEFGMSFDDALGDPASVYARTVSPELLGEIDADVVIIWASSAAARAEFEALPTYQQLGAAQRGDVVFVDDALANAINSPTLLSIPYVLEELVPALAAAAG